MTKPNACIDVLGFKGDEVIGPFASPPEVVLAPKVAAFNRVVSYFIKSSLVSGGIPLNQTSSGIIAQIPIDVKTGSLINYAPRNPIRCNAMELKGMAKQRIIYTLVDQLERDVSTFGEEWGGILNIKYSMAVEI
jgi:hypothetical protein